MNKRGLPPAVLVEREHAIHLLHEMLRIRRFEERCAELYQAEKIRGFLHLYIGEEAVGVGVMQALTREDAVVATYREHGQAIARGQNSLYAMGTALRRTQSQVDLALKAASYQIPAWAVDGMDVLAVEHAACREDCSTCRW